jgi:7-cyano-7-deazaguanine synthase in queuosine biosynthesis
MDRTMKYCKKCIITESYLATSFNDKSICNHCVEYKPYHKGFGEEKLLELIKSVKSEGKYDCVIPLSGGKDSTYILYYAVKKAKLKAIVVNYDSGFQTRTAKDNVRNACRILNVPLIEVKSPGKIQDKLIRESLLISEKVGSFVNFCGNCEALLRSAAMKVARYYKVPFVFWGSTSLESHYNENYERYLNLGRLKKINLSPIANGIKRKFIVLLKEPKKISRIPQKLYRYIGFHSIKYKVFSAIQRFKMKLPMRYVLRPHSIPPFTEENPRFIQFYDYISWNSMQDINVLKQELNWNHPDGRDSRFDCLLHCFANYNFLKMYNISSDGVNFCNFIREGKMTREEALFREENIRNSTKKECLEIIKRFGLKSYKLPSFWRNNK